MPVAGSPLGAHGQYLRDIEDASLRPLQEDRDVPGGREMAMTGAMTDPALALLAEALREAGWLAQAEPIDDVFGGPTGTRLLAALRDGLAVAATREYGGSDSPRPTTPSGKRLLDEWGWLRADHPPNTALVRDLIVATERDAVAAALAPETSDV